MTKKLGMYFGEKRMRKIAHRCDKILASRHVTAHYAWYGTSTGGGTEVWEEYVRNFLDTYKKEYDAGYHQMVAVATLLSLTDIYGINSSDYYGEHQFMCNLNSSCQMGKSGNYKHLPLCRVEKDAIISKALKKPAFKNCFILKVRCCDEEDGDPRTAQDIRMREIKYKI